MSESWKPLFPLNARPANETRELCSSRQSPHENKIETERERERKETKKKLVKKKQPRELSYTSNTTGLGSAIKGVRCLERSCSCIGGSLAAASAFFSSATRTLPRLLRMI